MRLTFSSVLVLASLRMEKSDTEVYNETKKLLDPHKAALEALMRKKEVTIPELEAAQKAFAKLVAATFDAIPGWEKKGALKRLRPSYDECVAAVTAWIIQKEATHAFDAIKKDISDVQARIAAAEKKQDWPEVLRLIPEFRDKRAHHFPEGGVWAKIGEQKRYNDGFKGYTETLEKRCASGMEFEKRQAVQQVEAAKKKEDQNVLHDWRALERRLRELNVPKNRAGEDAAISALIDECDRFLVAHKEQLGKEVGNATNFLAYQREISTKLPTPEEDGPRVSSWPDVGGFAGGSDFLCIASSNSLYRLDEAGQYELLGDYAAWAEVTGLTVFPGTGRVYLVSRSSIYSMDAKSGEYEQIGSYGGYTNVTAVCHAGDSIFVACNGHIYKVSPKDGDSEAFAGYGEWSGVTAMASAANMLFVWCRDRIYRIDPNSGKYDLLDGNWPNVTGVAGFRDHVFVISSGALYKIDAHKGNYEHVVGGWAEGKALAATGNKLFGISQTYLYDVNPITGADVRL